VSVGWLSNLLRPRGEGLNPFDDRYYERLEPGGPALAGVLVTPDAALRVSTVWGCVRLISESMATLPLFVYQKRGDGGRDRADNHPLAYLLRHAPNDWQTAFEFVEQMTMHVLLRGNAYAEIRPGARGLVDQLVPLHPDVVTVEKLASGRLRYQVADQGPGQQPRTLLDGEVFHLRGLSLDGVSGVSVITYARESIGLALATERHGATFFSQNATPPLVIEHPGRMGDKALQNLKQSWLDTYAGWQNAHKPGILEEGAKAHILGLTNEDAQFLQTREFQVVDIARWFRVPLHMIQETSKSTSWGTGIEQLSLAFVQFTLLPWVRRWEQAISRDLILASERYYAAFNVNALARGDQKSRYEAYQIGLQNSILCPDDVRAFEDMNPLPDGQGQTFWMPANIMPVERVLQEPAEPAGETNAPEKPDGSQNGNDEAESFQNGNAAEHYRLLLQEAAARILRKEQAALARAARRATNDGEWRAAVAEFYADHEQFVSQVLRIAAQTATQYAGHRALLAYDEGPAWPEQDAFSDDVGLLVQLALADQPARG